MKKIIIVAFAAIATASYAEDIPADIVSGEGIVDATTCATNVRSYAFAYFRDLRKVNADAATKIGHGAFIGCVKLTEVSFDSLVEIENLPVVFAGCGKIENVYIEKAVFNGKTSCPAFPWGIPPSCQRVTFHFANGKFNIRGDRVK